MAITSDDVVLSAIGALIGLAVTLPVTYLVVDRIVERNERKRLRPIEVMAKERLRSKLGIGSLTTFLITLAIDVRSSTEEKRALSREVAQLYISRLKSFQSDLEMLLGIYNDVFTIETEHTTANIIAQIDHLEEDLQYIIEIHPRHATETQVDHIEHVILVAVQLTKKELDSLGGSNMQVKALEEWLLQQAQKHVHPVPEEPIEVSGKHTLV
ncbi:MAG TPA: hypothetical protein VKF39_06115 [Nitrososphaerales archaeon]|nr:hypothetical protein [Nitrososphaerales archaeon]